MQVRAYERYPFNPSHYVYLHIGTYEQFFTASRRCRAPCMNRSSYILDVVMSELVLTAS